ncbi:hypothetical protein DPMN_036961 [Dreissena polymorpha]|uniref:Uncharacterized protein n=1 Tax=Dreissena polymorpha TaxID=45954 RepID=A0A9D4MCK2_DREPO|nr:hypothetical protein DPMN_036961 [Dreissena polymorpha]
MSPVQADAGYRPLNTSIFEAVPYLLHRADDQRVRLEHDNSTFWTTRTPPGDRKTKKSSLVRTRLTMRDCAPGNDRERLSSRQKICMDNTKDWTFLLMAELLPAPLNRPDWRRISVSSSLISLQRHHRLRE